jgi:succinate dehydrogenase hydrophobic membrane anchor protein
MVVAGRAPQARGGGRSRAARGGGSAAREGRAEAQRIAEERRRKKAEADRRAAEEKSRQELESKRRAEVDRDKRSAAREQAEEEQRREQERHRAAEAERGRLERGVAAKREAEEQERLRKKEDKAPLPVLERSSSFDRWGAERNLQPPLDRITDSNALSTIPNLDAWSRKILIAHKITGVILYSSMPLLVWFLYAVLTPSAYSWVQKFFGSYQGASLLFICILAATCHLAIGLCSIWLTSFASARPGSWRLRHQQLTAITSLALIIAFVWGVVGIWGRNQAAVSQIVGSTIPGLVLFLFVFSISYHMWIGMQQLINDRIEDERLRYVFSAANTLYSILIVVSSLYFWILIRADW